MKKWNWKFYFSQTYLKKSSLLICPYNIWKGDNILIFSLSSQSSDYTCHHYELVEKTKATEVHKSKCECNWETQDNSSIEALLYCLHTTSQPWEAFYCNNLSSQRGSTLQIWSVLFIESYSAGTWIYSKYLLYEWITFIIIGINYIFFNKNKMFHFINFYKQTYHYCSEYAFLCLLFQLKPGVIRGNTIQVHNIGIIS